jgi:hypothetical protein
MLTIIIFSRRLGGDPLKTRGFARGGEDLLIPGRLGYPLIVYFNTAGYFRKVK